MKKLCLTESQEILLGKFFDGEATLLERIRVRWLLDRNPQAVHYLEQLESTNSLLRKMFVAPEVSLWSQVSANIHRAQREQQESLKQFIRRPTFGFDTLFPAPIRYGLAGAIAASTLFFMMPVVKNSSGIEVSYDGNAWNNRPVAVQQAKSVGWIRSSGKAERIGNQSGRSPVVFIKRKYARSSEAGLPLLAERNSGGIIIQGAQ